jgi:hypothetical protein
VVVNQLLDLHGAPAIVVGGNKGCRITYTDILGWLEPLRGQRRWGGDYLQEPVGPHQAPLLTVSRDGDDGVVIRH